MSDEQAKKHKKTKTEKEKLIQHAAATGEPVLRQPVYVWELPVRIFHWIGVFMIVGLIITGLYIGNPAVIPMGEATTRFMMGAMRFWHAIFAYIFTANMLFRVYWFWAGNEYSKFPFWRKDFWSDIIVTVKHYLFLSKEHVIHVGHNSVAQLSYFLFVWVGGAIMIITGFIMRGGSNPEGIWQTLFGWLVPLFGGEYQVRNIHHLVTWFFIMFIIIHLYLAFRQDILDDDSSVSSIITGYKYELPSTIDHHLKDKYKKSPPDKNEKNDSGSAGEAMPDL